MKDSFDLFWDQSILEWEGGGAYHKVTGDSGGGTNWGVSDAADGSLDNMIDLDRDGDGDVRVCDLTESQAKQYYTTHYLDKIKFDMLPYGIDTFLADMAVNQGVYTASVALQEAVGAVRDGIIGKNTLKALGDHQLEDVLQDLGSIRADKYTATCVQRMVKYNDKEMALKFSSGWNNRLFSVYTSALNSIKYNFM